MRLTKKREDNGRYYLSGLTEVSNRYPKGYGRIQVGHAVEKLAEYEDLEEQGKLLKLPCAVGDVVHSFSMGKVLTLRVDSFVIYTDGIDARLISEMKEYEFLKIDMDIEDFGKKWFATQEEAEAALERTKNESNS